MSARTRPVRKGASFASRHPAATGLAVGAAAGVTFLALAVHFASTRNWTGAWILTGFFVAFIVAGEAWVRVERKRATGTYSYRFDRMDRAWRERQDSAPLVKGSVPQPGKWRRLP